MWAETMCVCVCVDTIKLNTWEYILLLISCASAINDGISRASGGCWLFCKQGLCLESGVAWENKILFEVPESAAEGTGGVMLGTWKLVGKKGGFWITCNLWKSRVKNGVSSVRKDTAPSLS